MSATLTRPDWSATIADLARRVGILERRLTGQTPAVRRPQDIIFSYAGALAAGESPPALTGQAATLATLAVAFAAGSAGTTDTTLEVKQEGTVIATVTVPASTEVYTAAVGVAVDGNQRLSLNVATAGTGATDMTATARFT